MTAPINAAYLEWRRSGGATNTDPNLSLGGVISSDRIDVQSCTGISNITGIAFLYAAGNLEGTGTLSYTASTKSFRWTPPGGGIGPAVACSEDCRLALFGASDLGQLDIAVTFASLSGTDKTDTLTINNILQDEFDNVLKAESYSGDTEYRCRILINVHPAETFLENAVYVLQQPSPGAFDIGKDPAGVGNGSTTGVPQTIANENTAPTGVTFARPSTPETGQLSGALAPGQVQAWWLRRGIPIRNIVQAPESVYLIGTQTYF